MVLVNLFCVLLKKEKWKWSEMENESMKEMEMNWSHDSKQRRGLENTEGIQQEI